MRVIGVDCATLDKKVGLALGDYESGELRVLEAMCGAAQGSAAAIVSQWIAEAGTPALLALDAPLGWPSSLGPALVGHRAGVRVNITPDDLFRRETDRFVERRLGKRPLDVGADRIARTAHSALQLLGTVRDRTALPVPLAWRRDFLGVEAIEVYPAATLVAHGFRSAGYKKRLQRPERAEIVQSLRSEITFEMSVSIIEDKGDALDAVVCLLSGKDFLEGRVFSPEKPNIAWHEGWIWTAPRSLTS